MTMPRRNNGIYLGRFGTRDEVRWRNTIHAVTIGANGSGKGTGVIVPNLASLPRSVFIIDPKAEALAITGRMRAKLGRVLVINPFNVLADKLPHVRSHGYNPMADIDETSDTFTDDSSLMALSLVPRQSGNDGAFFGGSAEDLVACLVMYEKLLHGKNANLGNARRMLTEPHFISKEVGPLGIAKTILEMAHSSYEPLRFKAGRFLTGSRSVMDIISTAINETRFLDSPAIRCDLCGPGFDWDLMKREIVTVYLVLPADRLESHANYLRLIVTSALRTLLRSPPSETLPPVLFILDEFAQLGYLPPIENAMGIARGFGVQLWPFLQDLNQLKALYKDRWQTFIGNAGCITAFAPRDLFTAKYLSELSGQKTEVDESLGYSDDGQGNLRVSLNRASHSYPLFRPEDLMSLPRNHMLCWADPVKYPFLTSVPGYWDTPYGQGLDPNPYFRTQERKGKH